jgi:hypothetical protein
MRIDIGLERLVYGLGSTWQIFLSTHKTLLANRKKDWIGRQAGHYQIMWAFA